MADQANATEPGSGKTHDDVQVAKSDRAVVLCSDGTGNKGGYGADSNVFKLYKAIDIHSPARPQVTYYDNGVGTASNKYLRAITGAFGFGFHQNVRDLYEFLARNYREGDKVFLFGFSRGAATVRAFAGMIGVCGLLDARRHCWRGQEGFIDEARFQELIDEAMKAYRAHRAKPAVAEDFKRNYAHPLSGNGGADGKFAIELVGVWDTVSALGWPQDWSFLVNWLFKGLEYVSNLVFPHDFYNYQTGPFVNRVYHALAIDDERKTFHPKVWDESRPDRPVHIEQVWFAGVHSSVGGGYPRAGLSNVALDWMMERAGEISGLVFKADVRGAVREDANVFGKLYDSRDGLAVYYRYAPRDIDGLCKDRNGKRRLESAIEIHESVFRRLKYKTAGYAPGQLPFKFESVATKLDQPPVEVQAAATERDWTALRTGIERWVTARKWLYTVFAETSLIFIAASWWLWVWPPKGGEPPVAAGFGWKLADYVARFLEYITPTFFDGMITYLTKVRPLAGLLAIAVLILFYCCRSYFRNRTQSACEPARRSILRQIASAPAAEPDATRVRKAEI